MNKMNKEVGYTYGIVLLYHIIARENSKRD